MVDFRYRDDAKAHQHIIDGSWHRAVIAMAVRDLATTRQSGPGALRLAIGAPPLAKPLCELPFRQDFQGFLVSEVAKKSGRIRAIVEISQRIAEARCPLAQAPNILWRKEAGTK